MGFLIRGCIWDILIFAYVRLFRALLKGLGFKQVNPQKLETGLRTTRAGIPNVLLFRIEAIGFPTFVGLLL